MGLHSWWIGSIILLTLGVIFAAAAAVLKAYSSRDTRHGKITEARVVEIIAQPRTGEAALSEFRNRQAAVFEFYAEGRLYKVTDSTDEYPCPYYMNQRLKICYHPAEPEKFSVVQENRWSRIAFGMSYLSIVCILLGCLFFLMHASRIEL